MPRSSVFVTGDTGEGRIREATAASEEEIREILEPEVADWFTDRFDSFTPPQRYALQHLHDRHNVLVSSPTGTGKTLSAFLAGINELVHEAKDGGLEDRVYILYVSPLKALNNDIERNLEAPLDGVADKLAEAGHPDPGIRVGVRTGDTPKSERQKMTRTPPHILITTPESLGILLNSPTFSDHLTETGWVIVDEVHSLAEGKRGTHLMLSLERLEAMIEREADEQAGQRPEPPPQRPPAERGPVRIGLSATIHPLDEIAGFLVGRDAEGRSRPCQVVDVTYAKDVEVDVFCPTDDILATGRAEVTDELYETLDEQIRQHDTTLVFTNTRAGTERVVHRLIERDPGRFEGTIGAHHGSLSKQRRHEVEDALREGEMDAVVTSTSLELGIDIGSIDLVVLLSSPRGVSRALQRIGRSGHKLGAKSQGLLVALDHDDLVECTVIAENAREGKLDPLSIPDKPLDVLCQHVVGMALTRVWDTDEALQRIRQAYPYRDLSREDYEACLAYLEGPDELEDQRVYGKIWWDEEDQTFGRRGKKTRPIYYTNIGTIPDSTQLSVRFDDETVGTVDEEFVETLSKGDVFVLGGNAWEYRGASPVKARVSPARTQRPTVPRWVSETLPLSFEMAQRVARFRKDLATTIRQDGVQAARRVLETEHELAPEAAESLATFLRDQALYAGVPGPDEALVEEHSTQEGRTRMVFHTPIGRRGCEGLARAFAHRVEATKDCSVSWMNNDYGFVLTLPEHRKVTRQELRSLFLIDLDDVLYEAIDDAELLRRRFRYVAGRALMILRNYLGTDISVGRQNAKARRLLRHLQRERPNSPVLAETYREILTDALDYPNAEDYLFRFVSRQASVRFERDLPGPSPLAFNLVAATSAAGVLNEDASSRLERFHEDVQDAIAASP
ncbi:hypothetical protein BRD56_08645 [Thermoplasmatales archaeon SW_10_69_26]|nr:MAG: hypothetical protein BRD56_08645 [Thermoplasmatales archaeon SW_10_69_26]